MVVCDIVLNNDVCWFQNSLYSALPFVGLWAIMNVCPVIADKLRSTGVMSTVAVRKLFNSIGIQFAVENFANKQVTIHEHPWKENTFLWTAVTFIHKIIYGSYFIANAKTQTVFKGDSDADDVIVYQACFLCSPHERLHSLKFFYWNLSDCQSKTLQARFASLWLPYVIGQTVTFSSCGFFFLSSFFSSPNLSRCRLDVYHTFAHGVALVRI